MSRPVPIHLLIAALLILAAGCGDEGPTGPGQDDWVDLFPVPVGDASSLFPSVDDAVLAVAFTGGFRFSFYGTQYDTVWLNTNGGFTFGAGVDSANIAAEDVTVPGVGVFWGDMDAAATTGSQARAHQMRYAQLSDRFYIQYDRFQESDSTAVENTATVILHASGRIHIQYGMVQSSEILVGIWDGTHSDDEYLAVLSEYNAYRSIASGLIIYDSSGLGPAHVGQLLNRSLIFSP